MATRQSAGSPSSSRSRRYPAASSPKETGFSSAAPVSSTKATTCRSDPISIPANLIRSPPPLARCFRSPRCRCSRSRLCIRGRAWRLGIPFELSNTGRGRQSPLRGLCLIRRNGDSSRTPFVEIVRVMSARYKPQGGVGPGERPRRVVYGALSGRLTAERRRTGGEGKAGAMISRGTGPTGLAFDGAREVLRTPNCEDNAICCRW